MVAGREKACFAVTEPNTGLNTTQLKTKAEKMGHLLEGLDDLPIDPAGAVAVIDAETGEEIRTFEGHMGAVFGVADYSVWRTKVAFYKQGSTSNATICFCVLENSTPIK